MADAVVPYTKEKPLLRWRGFRREGARSDPGLTLDQWSSFFSFNNLGYMLNPTANFTLGFKEEAPLPSYEGFASSMYKGSSVIFACMEVRSMLFSEARMVYQRMREGRPGDYWSNSTLGLLERPWVNGTTGDLLSRMEQSVSLAGNFYAWRKDAKTLIPMRPDWVTIVLGSQLDPDEPGFALDCEVLGYAYQPGGPARRKKPIPLLASEVVHYAPTLDPLARYRGMSWLSPVVREVMADSAATTHKLKFFENGATPNLSVVMDKDVSFESWQKWRDDFEQKFGEADGTAALNAYKTLFLGGGADVSVIGANMRQIDFKMTQGAGETRIAAAAGVPPVIVGLSEGLQSATYSNYAMAMRRFTDLTMRPLWRKAAGALASVMPVPSDSRLWYDDRDIPALAGDAKDNADIQQLDATTIKTLIDAGFESDSVVAAVTNQDFTFLKHSGLYSVQLQPAGTVGEGKGSLVQGVVIGKDGKPVAAPGTTSGEASAILEEFIGRELARKENGTS